MGKAQHFIFPRLLLSLGTWSSEVQRSNSTYTLNTDILDFWEGSGVHISVLTGKFPSSNMTVVCSNISVGRNLCIF